MASLEYYVPTLPMKKYSSTRYPSGIRMSLGPTSYLTSGEKTVEA
jgi:hypothetical protein